MEYAKTSAIHSSYLNTKQAAHYVGLSESLLEKRRCNGDGPIYSQIGKAVRYLASDLDEWMQASRRRSTTSAATEAAA